MIVYQQNCETFMADVRESNIDYIIHQQFQQKLHHRTSESEVNSWKNSMQYMKNVLEVAGIPSDAMVTIECQIPQTSKRIDFILTGTLKNQKVRTMLKLMDELANHQPPPYFQYKRLGNKTSKRAILQKRYLILLDNRNIDIDYLLLQSKAPSDHRDL
jgi:hypothetical protein